MLLAYKLLTDPSFRHHAAHILPRLVAGTIGRPCIHNERWRFRRHAIAASYVAPARSEDEDVVSAVEPESILMELTTLCSASDINTRSGRSVIVYVHHRLAFTYRLVFKLVYRSAGLPRARSSHSNIRRSPPRCNARSRLPSTASLWLASSGTPTSAWALRSCFCSFCSTA